MAERFVYDPYGKTGTPLLNMPYLFQGGRYDTTTGLSNFRNRDLSPTLGRWMQEDPKGYLLPGKPYPAATSSANQTLLEGNLYGFVGDTPINLDDPSGTGGVVLSPGRK